MRIKQITTRILFFLIVLLSNQQIGAQDFMSTQKIDEHIVFKSKFSSEDLNEAAVKLIPFPQEVKWGKERITLNTLFVTPSIHLSSLLQKELDEIFSDYEIQTTTETIFKLEFIIDEKLPLEGYNLTVSKNRISIRASDETGHYYALQTLRQLMGNDNENTSVQLCEIKDWPAFPIRGYMIDVGRNFLSIANLEKQLDIMAQYKMNIFHWHLTDNPAWRIESIKYPQLTAAENHRASRDPGKYYSYDEIRHLIAYAKERKITIIPEIDMPGHSESFRTAMGHTMESEQGMVILEHILTEFFKEIPKELAPMIHIGSDEIHIQNPEEFIERMVSFLENNDRKAIIWSPGLEAKNSVIRQTWGSADAVQGDFEEIDSRKSYINSGEPMTQVNRLLFKPIGADSNNKILGGILCLWPDVNVDKENDMFLQNPVYSSLLTYAWSTWTADIESSPVKYRAEVPLANTEAGYYFKAFEAFLIEHKLRYFKDEPFQYLAQSDKFWNIIGPFDPNDGDDVVNDLRQQNYRYKGKELKWIPAVGNTLVLRQRWGEGGFYPDVTADQTAYALTFIYSDKERDVESWINFETPTRSNRVYTGIGQKGEWDQNGGAIFINDKKLKGPQWKNPGWKTARQVGWGLPIEQEIPWANEELYWLRAPTIVRLQEGWNKVFVKIPTTSEFQNWMFTFAPLDMNGLRFSRNPD